MLNAGVVGFKCFLIHSGVDDFPHVERADLETALQTLQGTDATVLVSYGKIDRLVYVLHTARHRCDRVGKLW